MLTWSRGPGWWIEKRDRHGVDEGEIHLSNYLCRVSARVVTTKKRMYRQALFSRTE